MTKFTIIMVIGFLGLSVSSAFAFAEPVYVVVNKNNTDEINPELIKLIYSDKKSAWKNGNDIRVFELPVKSQFRKKFSQHILNKSPISSQRDWSNRFVNNTLNNDVNIKPQRLVSRFVGKYENAIGYIPESEFKNIRGLRVVMRIE